MHGVTMKFIEISHIPVVFARHTLPIGFVFNCKNKSNVISTEKHTSLVFRMPWIQISINRPKPKVLWLSSDSSGTHQIIISKQSAQSCVWCLGGARELFSKTSTPVLGSPNIVLSKYWGVPSMGTKQPGHKANHSPPSRAEVKNEWTYTSTSYMCPHSVDRDNFTFNTHNMSGSQLLTDMLWQIHVLSSN